jgi:hypothetical protein
MSKPAGAASGAEDAGFGVRGTALIWTADEPLPGIRNLTAHCEQTVFFPACSGEILYALPQLGHWKRTGASCEGGFSPGNCIAVPHCLHAKARPANLSAAVYFFLQDGHSAEMFMDVTPMRPIRDEVLRNRSILTSKAIEHNTPVANSGGRHASTTRGSTRSEFGLGSPILINYIMINHINNFAASIDFIRGADVVEPVQR